MITVQGFTFQPHAVHCLSPIEKLITRPGDLVQYSFTVVVSGYGLHLKYDTLQEATSARDGILHKAHTISGGELA